MKLLKLCSDHDKNHIDEVIQIGFETGKEVFFCPALEMLEKEVPSYNEMFWSFKWPTIEELVDSRAASIFTKLISS